ncbi:flagellar P-ring protein 2 [Striga asiatica]|uniref:Flagellar P-ring protein 2 n=1 Tax=Striga asiatica TaxID=4170 RepID=A0A5A7QJ23_STRAF|nr:flagellar P-ring protein 2 [Striga asiatica]
MEDEKCFHFADFDFAESSFLLSLKSPNFWHKSALLVLSLMSLKSLNFWHKSTLLLLSLRRLNSWHVSLEQNNLLFPGVNASQQDKTRVCRPRVPLEQTGSHKFTFKDCLFRIHTLRRRAVTSELRPPGVTTNPDRGPTDFRRGEHPRCREKASVCGKELALCEAESRQSATETFSRAPNAKLLPTTDSTLVLFVYIGPVLSLCLHGYYKVTGGYGRPDMLSILLTILGQ